MRSRLALFDQLGLRWRACAGSFSSLFNALGRISWGQLGDTVSFRTAIVLLSALFAALVASFWVTQGLGRWAFGLWVCAAFFCLGGNFALFPAATAKNFGTTHAGPNYGLIFTSTIACRLVGALVLSTNDPSGQAGWRNLMLWFGAISALAALVGATFRPRTGAAARGALQGRGPASSW